MYKGLLVYFSPFLGAILVHRAYGPKKSVNFSLDEAYSVGTNFTHRVIGPVPQNRQKSGEK